MLSIYSPNSILKQDRHSKDAVFEDYGLISKPYFPLQLQAHPLWKVDACLSVIEIEIVLHVVLVFMGLSSNASDVTVVSPWYWKRTVKVFDSAEMCIDSLVLSDVDFSGLDLPSISVWLYWQQGGRETFLLSCRFICYSDVWNVVLRVVVLKDFLRTDY